jgi:hypothetical protein
MTTLNDLHQNLQRDPDHGMVHLMDFVDDFRHEKNPSTIAAPFPHVDERWDALVASTVEYLCREQQVPVPDWVGRVAACRNPWFVSGMENLKAISLVESPLPFRLRKIFVLENFLSRA